MDTIVNARAYHKASRLVGQTDDNGNETAYAWCWRRSRSAETRRPAPRLGRIAPRPHALSSLPGLATLRVGGEIGDEGIKSIARLTHLRELDVLNPRASADALLELAKLEGLRVLGLFAVPDDVVTSLRRALPQCHFHAR